ncbi:hypothetical protein L1887_10630 [Cichorium endivia]|nr:hypothetical protein L1887_10630 [Cichorium endivia]
MPKSEQMYIYVHDCAKFTEVPFIVYSRQIPSLKKRTKEDDIKEANISINEFVEIIEVSLGLKVTEKTIEKMEPKSITEVEEESEIMTERLEEIKQNELD